MFKTYLRILAFGKPYTRYALPYFICILLHAVFNAATFGMLIPIISTMVDGDGMIQTVTELSHFELSQQWFNQFFNWVVYSIFGIYTVKDLFMILAIITVIISFLSNLFRYLSQRIMENLRIHTVEQIRNEVYDNVMSLHVSYFSNSKKGDIISRITSDVQVVQFCVTNTLQVLFREPLLIGSYIFILVFISWKLTLFTIAVLPLIALFIGYIVKHLRRAATEGQQSFSEMVSMLDESLGAIKTIKGYNATEYVKMKFRHGNTYYSDIQRAIARRQQLASPMSEFLGISSIAFILVYGGTLILGGEISTAAFITYLGVFSQVTRPARAITDAIGNINQGIAAGERILDLLYEKPEIQNKENAIELTDFQDSIEFKDVKFKYEDREVLHGIDFKIPKGKTIALVGASGGGKSTISDLIPRFYDPQSGDVMIDGKSIKDYSISSIRSFMGIVAQETILFNDTIENNIRMGNTKATREDIIEAVKIANAYEFIKDLPEGLDTNIGDRGTKLSGGQRQRISIARAVLRNPMILILDEATSALDTESERLVQDSLSNLLKGRTSLVIAHRLSTIQNADCIYVVDEGTIKEFGTHEELLSKNGIYARLIEMQQL